jgi:hypothetical protein
MVDILCESVYKLSIDRNKTKDHIMVNVVSGNTLDVHFINSGYGTDEGVKTVQLFDMILDQFQRPTAIVCSPFGLQDTRLTAEFKDNTWVCDLD